MMDGTLTRFSRYTQKLAIGSTSEDRRSGLEGLKNSARVANLPDAVFGHAVKVDLVQRVSRVREVDRDVSRGVAVGVGHREGPLNVHCGSVGVGRFGKPEDVDRVEPRTVFDHRLAVVVANREMRVDDV